MSVLVLKLNATGDVVRTTTILHKINDDVTWVTARSNRDLLKGIIPGLRCLEWEERRQALDREYDLLINLEDALSVAEFAHEVEHGSLFGAYTEKEGCVRYTDDSRRWFDLSLISVFGRERADALKLSNRRSYQELIFEGLGYKFNGENYLLPPVRGGGLRGDIAIAPVAGSVWPMKGWAYYPQLQQELESRGFRVNVLPTRPTLLEHLADVQGHNCLVSGDSLPMHLALGSGIRCVTLFNCTSPWEIFDYGIQTKIVSPLLATYFYQRGMNTAATTAISLEEVMEAVLGCVACMEE